MGLICGIEIHQQLDTAAKLFCGCPTMHREVAESNNEFFRYLRPSRSELGEVDRAALEEVLVARKFFYKSYDTTCLVEADEEPPREINPEAVGDHSGHRPSAEDEDRGRDADHAQDGDRRLQHLGFPAHGLRGLQTAASRPRKERSASASSAWRRRRRASSTIEATAWFIPWTGWAFRWWR